MANIRLKELVEASVDPKLVARSKESGKLVYFKTPQAKDAALKAGSHEDPNAKKGGQPKVDAKPNDMFGGDYAKDRGGNASLNRKWVNYDKDHSIDTNSGMIVPKGKESNNPNPNDIKGIDSIGTPAKVSSARKWVNYDKDHSIDTNSGMIVTKGKESDTPDPKDIKGMDSIDTSKADMDSDSASTTLKTDRDGSVSFESATSIEKLLNKKLGANGVADVNDNGAIEYTIPTKDGNWDNALYIGKDKGSWVVSLESNGGTDDTKFGNDWYKRFKNPKDAVNHIVMMASKYKKELGGSSTTESTKLTSMLKK